MYPNNSSNRKIHINPNFKGRFLREIAQGSEETKNVQNANAAHINPRFLQVLSPPRTIHMNPNFIGNKLSQLSVSHPTSPALPKTTPSLHLGEQIPSKTQSVNKIITKSRTHIVREPNPSIPPLRKTTAPSCDTSNGKLLLLTKRKLVRASNSSTTVTSASNCDISKLKPKRSKTYKIDNRLKLATVTISPIKRRQRAFVARYALRRSSSAGELNVRATPNRGSAKHTQSDASTSSVNKQLRLININGLLYKATGNKLQREVANAASLSAKRIGSSIKPGIEQKRVLHKTSSSGTATAPHTMGRTLYVHGTKYIMDPKGFKLTRAGPSTAASLFSSGISSASTCLSRVNKPTLLNGGAQRRRIDIGGLTYIASNQSRNVFVCTNTHLALAHVNTAKQRSVNLLSRCLRKTNKPCPIYQRLGKCAALERNRCSKVHDKKQVAVCPKFVKGQCSDPNCLLSHNKSFQKMPVCKFYLQGSCVRSDCPYLHKKLSDNCEFCEDFRRGFCALGEKCNKQHIFPGSKTQPNRSVKLKNDSQDELQQGKNNNSEAATTATTSKRYFDGEKFVLLETDASTATNNDTIVLSKDEQNEGTKKNENLNGDETQNYYKRKKLGPLPAFIPFS